MLIIQKFGGTSVADANRLKAVAKIVTKSFDAGNKVVVVVSAQGKTTDELLKKAYEVNNEPTKRELDMLLSTGEQQTIALLAMTIQSLGYNAVSFNGWQAGMLTNNEFSNAKIKTLLEKEKILDELEDKIVIVAGFQGHTKNNEITTLGRGGSDTTAVAIAAELEADLCEIYTDVNGVYTSDPRLVKDAVKLEKITYEEMFEMALHGANVLHPRAVELASKHDVKLVVRSSFEETAGTIITKDIDNGEIIKGITTNKNIARVTLTDIPNEIGIAYKIFEVLSKGSINVDLIVQSIGKDDKKEITFTVDRENLKESVSILNKEKDYINFNTICFDDTVAEIAIIGVGMIHAKGIAKSMFKSISEQGIKIDLISTSPIRISVLINEKFVSDAINAVHKNFFKPPKFES